MRLLAIALIVLVLWAGCLGSPEEGAPIDNSRPAAYLLTHPFPHLLVEVDYVEGHEPSAFALDALVSMLRNVTEKRTIKLLQPQEISDYRPSPVDKKEWTEDEVRALAAKTLDHGEPGKYGVDETAVLHVLYLDGEYAETPAMGLAIGATIFMFGGDGLHPLPRVWLERSVLIHEAGHVIGLVNNGLPMQRNHEDPESRHHSSNPNSVMSVGWEFFDGRLTFLFPDEVPPYEFDADDMADIRAFQGRAPH